MLRISRITCKKDSQRENLITMDGYLFLTLYWRYLSVIIEDCPFTVFLPQHGTLFSYNFIYFPDLQKHERVKPTNGTIRFLCCRSNSHCSRLGYLDGVTNSDNQNNFLNNRTSDSKRVFQKKESISKECLCQRRSLCTPPKHSTSYDKSDRVVCSPSQCTCFPLNDQQRSAYIQCCQTGNLNHGEISTNSFPEHSGYLSNQPNPTSVSRFHQSVCTCHFSDTEITTHPSIENDTDASMLSQSVSLTSFFSASSNYTRKFIK